MKNPLVSIVIPVYNGSNYLAEAIDSALSQTYKNIEIIVVNDGSNDNGATEQVALSYKDKIRYFLKKNGGSSSALNYGIKQMKGEFFSWLSHDDMYTPEKIKKQIDRAMVPELFNKSFVVRSGFGLINSEGEKIYYCNMPFEKNLSSQEAFYEFFGGRLSINGCALLIPKKVLDENGFFNEEYIYVNDTDYWVRLMLSGCFFVCHNDILVKSRVHSQQVSQKKKDFYFKERKSLFKTVVNILIEKKYEHNMIKSLLFSSYKDLNFASAKYLKQKMIELRIINYKDYPFIFYSCIYGIIRKIAKTLYHKFVKNRNLK